MFKFYLLENKAQNEQLYFTFFTYFHAGSSFTANPSLSKRDKLDLLANDPSHEQFLYIFSICLFHVDPPHCFWESPYCFHI